MPGIGHPSDVAVETNLEFVLVRMREMLGSGELEVPVLPEVAARVVSFAANPSTDSQRLAKIITTDQALASHVMRVVGTAVYQPHTPIVSLQQAITWLGMAEIADIAFTVAVLGRILNVPGYKREVSAMWREAVATGLWAREIGAMARLHGDSMYLCGLLLRIGRPVVLQIAGELSRREHAPLTVEQMMSVVTEFESVVGERVLRAWCLPEM